MKNTKNIIITFCLVTIILLAGCSSTANVAHNTKNNEAIRIGLSVPLTGPAASWGQNALAGTTLAVKEINAKGGINDRRIQIIAEDDKCGDESVNVYQRLINAYKVKAILGPVCSTAAGPALPIVKDYNIPNVIITASAAEFTSIGDNIFRVYPSDAKQGEYAAKFIFNEFGKKKTAIIYANNAWGKPITDKFVEEYISMGGEISYKAGILDEEKDFKLLIAKIKETDAEVLYLPLHPTNGLMVLKQIKEAGIDIPIISGDGLAGEEILSNEYAEGILYTMAESDISETFKNKIKTIPGYKNLEVSIAATYAYDAAIVMFDALKKSDLTSESINANLRKTRIPGVTNSIIEFDNIGDIKNVKFQTYKIENGESVVYN